LAVGIGGLALLGVFLFNRPMQNSAAQVAQHTKPVPPRRSGLPKVDLANAPASPTAPTDKTPAASGLPKPGEGPMNLVASAEPAAMDPATPTPATPTATTSPTPTPTAPIPAPAATPTPTPTPATAAEPKPTGDAKPEAPAAPAAEPELTSDEKKAWEKGMTQAKDLIGKQDFTAAEERLAELKPTAKTTVQRGQLERLEQVLGFVKDIRQAMVDAIASLGPADTFKIGSSTMAAFVEGNAQKITVRVSGERRSYPLEEIPVAMAIGLVDLKLDVAHATTLARKGAYIVMHPKNKTTLERGKQMLQEAADAGAISQELAKFYEDDYSLGQ
jgi:hypothetical protein